MIHCIEAEILENKKIVPDFYQITLACPEVAQAAKPGQFIMLKVSPTVDPLLKRPVSINRINTGEGTVTLIYQVIGKGTKLLSMISGGGIEVMGPLGRGFVLKAQYDEVAVVGGGCGIAPLLALVEELLPKSRQVHVLLGARTKELLLNSREYQKSGVLLKVATDDGSAGHRGFVSSLLEELLQQSELEHVFGCGPEPLLKKVVAVSQEHSVPCQVSLEERMACGIGACLGCVCTTKAKNGSSSYQRVCQDGPVFAGSEVIFNEQS
ncbi:MAG: dihydroorotate dehydrogenase electron transfer subunit [Peptococcaceae bacterium]